MTEALNENWRTVLLAIGLAAVIITSGCIGGGGGNTTPAPENTDAANDAATAADASNAGNTATATETATPTPTGPTFAQKFISDGSIDRHALRKAHSSLYLDHSSYSWSMKTNDHDTNKSASYKQAGHEAFRVTTHDSETRNLYINSKTGKATFQLVQDGEEVYTGQGEVEKFNSTGWSRFRAELKSLEWSFDHYEERDGKTVAVFTASKVIKDVQDKFQYEKNLNAKLVIGESGIIYKFSVTGEAEEGTDASGTFTLKYTASTGDVSVEKPEWHQG